MKKLVISGKFPHSNYRASDINIHIAKEGMTLTLVFCHLLFIYLFIYLFKFMTVLGLRCCVRAFSSCSERGLLFIAVRGLLIVMVSLVAEHGL